MNESSNPHEDPDDDQNRHTPDSSEKHYSSESRDEGLARRGQSRSKGSYRNSSKTKHDGRYRNKEYSQDNRRLPLAEDVLFRGRNPIPKEETEFQEFLLDDNLITGIADSGYRTLTPLQKKMIPPLLERTDMIVQASKGAGKTAAYLIPVLHTISGRTGTRILVVTPTRNLSIQVYNEVRRLAHYTSYTAILLDPGSNIREQISSLEDDPEIIIGTPGRILDHLRRGALTLNDLDCLVLDEVDRLLDQGQRLDLEAIVKKIYSREQTIELTSTISPPVLRLCRKLVTEAKELLVAPELSPVEAVNQRVFKVRPDRKLETISWIIKEESPVRAIIFCRMKSVTRSVVERLNTLTGGVMELHMGLPQRKQHQIIKRFRENEFNILVTTDTFTRDLDIENISHVINYDTPEDPEDYLYRIGNTACLDDKGSAITLVTEEDNELFDKIDAFTDGKIKEMAPPGIEQKEKPKTTRPAKPAKTPETAVKPKQEFIHGGWHRKITRRNRR